mgnify:CR=1 FL=1
MAELLEVLIVGDNNTRHAKPPAMRLLDSGARVLSGRSGRSGGSGAGDIVVAHRSDLKIPGIHNVQNALAAIAVCAAVGADPEAMRDAIASFSGVEHRLEPAGEIGGVIFINDSIATTPSRTIAALLAMERPTVLIAGGYDKHLPFDEMAQLALGKVHTVSLVGVTADKIQRAFEEAAERAGAEPPAIIREDTFREAVEAARLASRPPRPPPGMCLPG